MVARVASNAFFREMSFEIELSAPVFLAILDALGDDLVFLQLR